MSHHLPAVGRVVMVTGASRGIGHAIMAKLAECGYSLSLGGRDIDVLDAALEAAAAPPAMTYSLDVRDAAQARGWAQATVARFGRIDAVVNNAGVLHPFSFEDDDEQALDQMWDVNVKGALRVIRAAYPYLKEAGSGRIANIVSLSGKRVKGESIGGYAMSKHAALALTHAARHAGWKHGIRATAVCPGWVATDMTADVEVIDAADMTRPETVAELVALVLALPNNASVSELPVNCVLESTV